MGGFRTHRDAARRIVHREFAVAALYRAGPESDWVPVTVRIHSKVEKFGDLPGMEGATFQDIAPKMIFAVADIDGVPTRGAVVSVSATEAWRVGESDPVDGEFVSAAVARVAASQLGTYPYLDGDGNVVSPSTPTGNGTLDFSDPDNSALVVLLLEAA